MLAYNDALKKHNIDGIFENDKALLIRYTVTHYILVHIPHRLFPEIFRKRRCSPKRQP